MVTKGDRDRVEKFESIPQSYFVIGAFILLWPINSFARSGRYRFLLSLKRVSVGGLAEAHNGKFGDILLADALTSYSKVLGDLVITFCMYFTRDISCTGVPDRQSRSVYVFPLVVAAPSAIRLRQCLIEYVRVRRAGAKRGGGQHLANALKYSTAFPIIILAAKLRDYNPLDMYGYSEMGLSRLL